jgi:hypothetical protein
MQLRKILLLVDLIILIISIFIFIYLILESLALSILHNYILSYSLYNTFIGVFLFLHFYIIISVITNMIIDFFSKSDFFAKRIILIPLYFFIIISVFILPLIFYFYAVPLVLQTLFSLLYLILCTIFYITILQISISQYRSINKDPNGNFLQSSQIQQNYTIYPYSTNSTPIFTPNPYPQPNTFHTKEQTQKNNTSTRKFLLLLDTMVLTLLLFFAVVFSSYNSFYDLLLYLVYLNIYTLATTILNILIDLFFRSKSKVSIYRIIYFISFVFIVSALYTITPFLYKFNMSDIEKATTLILFFIPFPTALFLSISQYRSIKLENPSV